LTGKIDETSFKEVVRRFIAAGRYPSTREILVAVGVTDHRIAFGLSKRQTQWRIEQLDAMGFDGGASHRASKLVPEKQSTQSEG